MNISQLADLQEALMRLQSALNQTQEDMRELERLVRDLMHENNYLRHSLFNRALERQLR